MKYLPITIDEVRDALKDIVPEGEWYTKPYRSAANLDYIEDRADNEVEVRWHYNAPQIDDIVKHLYRLTDFLKEARFYLIGEGYDVRFVDDASASSLSLVIKHPSKKQVDLLACRICKAPTACGDLEQGCCLRCYITTLQQAIKALQDTNRENAVKIETHEVASSTVQNILTKRTQEVREWRGKYNKLVLALRALVRRYPSEPYQEESTDE